MAMTTGTWVVLACTILTGTASQVENARSVTNATLPFRIMFNPNKMNQLPMDEEQPIQVFFQDVSKPVSSDYVLGIEVTNSDIAEIPEPLMDLICVNELPDNNVTNTENITSSGNFTVKGIFLGFSNLIFHICDRRKNFCNDTIFPKRDEITGKYNLSELSQWTTLDTIYRMSISRTRTVLDDVFTATVSIAVFISQIAIGCKTELQIIKEVLKRPIAPIIGFLCQFCIMPPVSFGIGKLVPLDPGQAVGLFTIGCAPGGGSSNIYTYLLLGDVSLSITMTLISTIASLGMIPLWMFTLGKLLLDQLGLGNVTIPYENIILSLVMVIVPVSIGLIIKHKKPEAAKKIAKITRPFMIIFLLFMFSFGIYVNLYMFRLFTPMVILAGFLVPLCGFLGGAAFSAICRQPWKRVKTIAVETGMQNTGVAVILILFSLPSPDAELALAGTISVTMFTPAFPLILVVFYEIKRRCCKKKPDGSDVDGEKVDGSDVDKEKGELKETEKAEPVGLDIYIERIKRLLPCMKKRNNEETVDTTDEKDGGQNEKKIPETAVDEKEIDVNKKEKSFDEEEKTADNKKDLQQADNGVINNGDINVGFVNDSSSETSF